MCTGEREREREREREWEWEWEWEREWGGVWKSLRETSVRPAERGGVGCKKRKDVQTKGKKKSSVTGEIGLVLLQIGRGSLYTSRWVYKI